MKKIGFIGLGIMGMPMACNLIRAGYPLVVYDLLDAPLKILSEKGAEVAGTCKDIARRSDIILTMLPNSPHVKTAVMGENGVLDGARDGQILIDMSSIAPQATKEVHDACQKLGVKMIDAPVSGGEPKAVDGSLSIMVGGDEAVFREVREILLKMGSSAVYCGEIGAGNTTKLANQIIVAVNIAALSEALTLGKKAGVSPESIFNAIKGGLAGSTVMNAKAPMMMNGDFKPGFRVDLHIKDLQNCLETAHDVGAPLPLCAHVMEMLQWLRANGNGQNDHSAIAKYYECLSGITIHE